MDCSNAQVQPEMQDIPYIHESLIRAGTLACNFTRSVRPSRSGERNSTSRRLNQARRTFSPHRESAGKRQTHGSRRQQADPVASLLGIELMTGRGRLNAVFTRPSLVNVSHKSELTERLLVDALASGQIPAGYDAPFAVILDEVPLPVVVKAAEEAADRSGTPLRSIWKTSPRGRRRFISIGTYGPDRRTLLPLHRAPAATNTRSSLPRCCSGVSVGIGQIDVRVPRHEQLNDPHITLAAVAEHDRLQQRGPAEPVHVVDIHARIDQRAHRIHMPALRRRNRAVPR